MKKFMAAILLAISMFFSTGISVYAYGGENTVSPNYLYTCTVKSTLIISGNTAYCKSEIKGDLSVTKIYATQYLEKKNGDKWEPVETWYDSVDENSIRLSNSKDSLGSGTYRVKTVATVYSGSNSEPIESTSKEVTI